MPPACRTARRPAGPGDQPGLATNRVWPPAGLGDQRDSAAVPRPGHRARSGPGCAVAVGRAGSCEPTLAWAGGPVWRWLHAVEDRAGAGCCRPGQHPFWLLVCCNPGLPASCNGRAPACCPEPGLQLDARTGTLMRQPALDRPVCPIPMPYATRMGARLPGTSSRPGSVDGRTALRRAGLRHSRFCLPGGPPRFRRLTGGSTWQDQRLTEARPFGPANKAAGCAILVTHS
jgi:hypothetical protein